MFVLIIWNQVIWPGLASLLLVSLSFILLQICENTNVLDQTFKIVFITLFFFRVKADHQHFSWRNQKWIWFFWSKSGKWYYYFQIVLHLFLTLIIMFSWECQKYQVLLSHFYFELLVPTIRKSISYCSFAVVWDTRVMSKQHTI